ncbi:MAG TPA: hypothetical protein VF017_18545 [Thermoanaerobaculia bacterium]|nr:hypothetical protein [Thermoanaerobaculia bacterium]
MDAKLKLYLSLAVFVAGAMLPSLNQGQSTPVSLLNGYQWWSLSWALPPFWRGIYGPATRFLQRIGRPSSPWLLRIIAGIALLPFALLYSVAGGGILHFVLHLRRMR